MKLQLAVKTGVDIDMLRNVYRPVATRGALLFFLMSEMAAVNPMYQYSLQAYLTVFIYSLRKALPDVIVKTRICNIINTLTMNIYEYGCTGNLI